MLHLFQIQEEVAFAHFTQSKLFVLVPELDRFF